MSGASAFLGIAVLMTCHNRRDLTLACLRSLSQQEGFRAENLFLVDDGSSDGTGKAVGDLLPTANVISGDGSLFWNGGMRLAWDRARAAGRSFEFYLWLNDDVVLADGALAMLVADADRAVPRGGAVIVSGAAHEPGKPDTLTYGASVRPDPARPLRLRHVAPTGQPQAVDTVSGNVVLVSAAAERVLGNLDPMFEHIFGDVDYGLRARKAGIPVMLASGYAGTCGANSDTGTHQDTSLPIARRMTLLRRHGKSRHARDWDRMVRRYEPGIAGRLRHRLGPWLALLRGAGAGNGKA